MIVFGSRGSDLALRQTRMVADSIQSRTGEPYRIEVIETRGDKIVDQPLPTIGGKGLFTAELEVALRDGRIDVAVHSLKDLPVDAPDGLRIGAVPERAAIHDVLVYDARHETSDGVLREGSPVGTSSPRRCAAVLGLESGLIPTDIRGNVPTRAAKARRGDYAAVVLAAAGIERLDLDLQGLKTVPLSVESFTPAPGQGALGVQCRAGDERVAALLDPIHDATTATCVNAERRVLQQLGGGCSMPLGVLVRPAASGFAIRATLYDPRSGECVVVTDEDVDPAALADRATAALLPFAGDPLRGRAVRVVRPEGRRGSLHAGLAVAGADVEIVALTRCEPVAVDAAALDATLGNSVLTFTSAHAVDRWFEELDRHGRSVTDEMRVFAGGPTTAEAVRAHGVGCTAPASGQGGGRALAENLLAAGITANDRVLFPCAEDRHDALERTLEDAGIHVTPLPLYRTRPIAAPELPDRDGAITVFTSPSSVEAFVGSGLTLPPGTAIALGPTTAAAMTRHEIAPARTADLPTPAAVVQAVAQTTLELEDAR